MDAIRELIKKTWAWGVAGLIVGIILGILYGWVISPVQWTDAAVEHLRADLQEEYLRMAIDSYAFNPDPTLAKKRFEDMGPGGEAILARILQSPGEQNLQVIAAYQATVLGGAAPLVEGTPETMPEGSVGETEVAPSARRSVMSVVLPIMCVVTLLLAGGLFYMFIWRSRKPDRAPATPAAQAQEAVRQAEWTDYAATGQEPPMVQFMSSYKLGDDLFDESFSVDSPAGEFLGECGVGISETIGVGDPKKVAAFEVWLFDKNDIQTVTKVLMSAHSYLDEASRQRLAAKGEPVLVEPGTESVLETQTLRLVARIVDMGYGEGALPERSFFDRVVLELAIWSKS